MILLNFLYQETHEYSNKKFEEYFDDYGNNVVNHHCAGQGNHVFTFSYPMPIILLVTKQVYEKWSSVQVHIQTQ